MAETKSAAEKSVVATKSNQAEPVKGYYESIDISILQTALLAQQGFTINKVSSLVEPIGTHPSLTIPTYLLSAFSAQIEFSNAIIEAICLALLNKAPIKQILFPYRLTYDHWITCRIMIDKSTISCEKLDSLGANNTSKESFEKTLEVFFRIPQNC